MKRQNNSFYERYWNHNEVLEDFYYKWPVIKKHVPNNEHITILDFGCGKGKIFEELVKMNPQSKIIGVDVSEKALNFIKHKYPKQQFFKITDGGKLPFKANTFDFIIASDVLEHVYDTENAFWELARILKKNGKILISVPYNGTIKNVVITIFFYELVFNPYSPHIRFFSKKSLANCLKNVHLQATKWGYYGRFFPLSNGMYVVAKK